MALNAGGTEWRWTEMEPTGRGRTTLAAVTEFDGKLWVLGGSFNSGTSKSYTNNISYTTDGITWAQVEQTPPWEPRDYADAVIFNNELWLLGGQNTSSPVHREVWSSPDGTNWTKQFDAPVTLEHAVVFEDSIWIVGLASGRESIHKITKNEQFETVAESFPWGDSSSIWITDFISFKNALYAYVWNGGVGANEVWVSDDGASWSKVSTQLPPARDRTTAAVANNRLFLLGGLQVDGSGFATVFNDVWYTEDFSEWHEYQCLVPWDPRTDTSVATFNNAVWLVGGNSSADQWIDYNDVWRFGPVGTAAEGEGAAPLTAEGEGAPLWQQLHSMDVNGSGSISLSELLSGIQLFNAGQFHCADVCGFATGLGPTGCTHHTADYNPTDWQITLSELLRAVQLYNLSPYTYCPNQNTEDGFCVSAQ